MSGSIIMQQSGGTGFSDSRRPESGVAYVVSWLNDAQINPGCPPSQTGSGDSIGNDYSSFDSAVVRGLWFGSLTLTPEIRFTKTPLLPFTPSATRTHLR